MGSSSLPVGRRLTVRSAVPAMGRPFRGAALLRSMRRSQFGMIHNRQIASRQIKAVALYCLDHRIR